MADSSITKINSAGKWLHVDAAASYFRMLDAGMPAGGIAAAGRTYAEQKYLYNLYRSGRGNLAQNPDVRPSAHQGGRALDITRGTAAHTWATVGGVRLKTHAGESIRANDFGWVRTVISEAWHFAYYPEKDKFRVLKKGTKGLYVKYIQSELKKTSYGADLKADGAFGPLMEKAVKALQKASKIKADGKVGDGTRGALKAAVAAAKATPAPIPTPDPKPTPKPTPVPTPPSADQQFRFGQMNLRAQRFGGHLDSGSDRGKFLESKMNCSIYALSEVTETARNAIRKVLGSNWKTYPIGYTAVMWDSAKWKHVTKSSVAFGTANVHGAVSAHLVGLNGEELDVISVHIRPNDAIGGSDSNKAAGKQSDIKKALTLVRKGVPTVIAGDFSTSKVEKLKAAGFVQAHESTDTYDKAGKQSLDFVFVTPDLVIRDHSAISGGSTTDHNGWVINLTLLDSNTNTL